MTFTPDEVAAPAVKGLTQAQRRTVLALGGDPRFARRRAFSALAASNLVARGIVAVGWDEALSLDTYYLTPFGLAVRDCLREQEN